MPTPIDMMLEGVEWIKSPDENGGVDNDLPHVTHSGVLEIMGAEFKCYRLSDGNTVFDADDVESFLYEAK